MNRWLIPGCLILLLASGCEEKTAQRVLDRNPHYAGPKDEHTLSAEQTRSLLRQRLLKVQTDR